MNFSGSMHIEVLMWAQSAVVSGFALWVYTAPSLTFANVDTYTELPFFFTAPMYGMNNHRLCHNHLRRIQGAGVAHDCTAGIGSLYQISLLTSVSR
jgi:hypothetical protein